MKYFFLLLLCFAISACTTSMGQVTTYKVKQKQLTSPLVKVSYLNRQNNPNIIYRSTELSKKNNDDVFSIYMTDAFFKYLPDLFGINEVIIVLEFEEVTSGEKEKDTIYKILGPYEYISDGVKAPFLNKLLYGPKRMESEILTMGIKIYEYDVDENEGTNSLFDFIATASDVLALSNPITPNEVQVASEFAKSIINMNDNDLVFQIEMDFVAGDNNYTSADAAVLPLEAGALTLIKQEGCALLTCYEFFSQDESISNPMGLVADLVSSPFVAISRGFTDTPNNNALSDINSSEIDVAEDDSGLVLKKAGDNPIPYTDKTWVRLAIVKGGNPHNWSVRKLMFDNVSEVEGIMKGGAIDSVAALEEAITDLNKTKQKITKMEESVKINQPIINSQKRLNGTYFVNTSIGSPAAIDICLTLPTGVELIDDTVKLGGYAIETVIKNSTQSCFKVTNTINKTVTPFVNSKVYYFQTAFTLNSIPDTYYAPLKLVKDVVISEKVCKLDSGDFQLTLSLNDESFTKSIKIGELALFIQPGTKEYKITVKNLDGPYPVSLDTIFKTQRFSANATKPVLASVNKCT